MTCLCQVPLGMLGNVSYVFLVYVLECATFRFSRRANMGIKENSSLPILRVNVSKRSECLALCLDSICTMFTYTYRYGSDVCLLYTMPFVETMTEPRDDTYLYIRECISTGTYWLFYLFADNVLSTLSEDIFII